MSQLLGTVASEKHRLLNIGWLRAAVLGANDGIISTASLLAGVVAAQASSNTILIVGVSGLVAGALSMAAGEYVSVSSQADTESADLATEKRELKENPVGEFKELANIYISRGLSTELAERVAKELMEKDALAAHARDELGITEASRAQPIRAALASAASFIFGAIVPLGVALLSPPAHAGVTIFVAVLFALLLLGILSAHVSGASKVKTTLRIVIWGAIAMLTTSLIGSLATPK